jgi:Cu-processing system permease protein
MQHAIRVFRYEFNNLIRSRWLLVMLILLAAVTELLFRFGGDPARTVTSLMNVVLIAVPLFASVLGTMYVYNSREFNELLLAQPIGRASIFVGKLSAFAGALSLTFLVGTTIPFLLHAYNLSAYAGKIITLLAVGVALVVIFSAVAFVFATRFDDRVKGLGLAILVWFFFTVLYDGALLLYIYAFQDYRYEPGLLAMVFLNPVDIGRILILLKLDISALMGYTGAVFRKVFGDTTGVTLSLLAMVLYTVVPAWLGLRTFRRKDF